VAACILQLSAATASAIGNKRDYYYLYYEWKSSAGRVAAARELATQTAGAAASAEVDGATVAAEAAGAVSAEHLSPKLALVSHVLALAATPAP
jgi:hypothetical protein